MNAPRIILFCALALASTVALPGWRQAPETGAVAGDRMRVVERARPTDCLACPHPIDGPCHEILHEGRRVHVHFGPCTDAWVTDGERLFRKVEANGALFDEDAVDTRRVSVGWLLVGLYVLAGLVSGAACAYVATAKGHRPLEWFVLGLLFNVPAVLTVLFMSRADTSALPQGVPSGLRKVPTTRAPDTCAACGAELHPAARWCLECGAAHEPKVAAETERI